MKKQTIIAIIITVIAMWIAHRIDIKTYEKMCQESIDWAIQDTSDTLLAYCEEKIEQIQTKE